MGDAFTRAEGNALSLVKNKHHRFLRNDDSTLIHLPIDARPYNTYKLKELGIGIGEPTGAFGPFGYNQKISGFLDEIVDVNGKWWNGYALFVGPEELTEQMIRDGDFSIVDALHGSRMYT